MIIKQDGLIDFSLCGTIFEHTYPYVDVASDSLYIKMLFQNHSEGNKTPSGQRRFCKYNLPSRIIWETSFSNSEIVICLIVSIHNKKIA